ncbi:MAG: type II toxin-antitoxin system RelE/ParE family toxin [Gemmatimonadetes bacterium]|nr:type II toxin-antitoxin system RelE/ParE family toxin [Gemmatimonadota bacterium]
MPKTRVVLYRTRDGRVPILDWLDGLTEKARAKCVVRVERLADLGHELRRPEADYLRDGVHELRAKHGGINYRMLYFFHGRDVVVVSHGLLKQRSDVPEGDIELALWRKRAFEEDPSAHTHEE